MVNPSVCPPRSTERVVIRLALIPVLNFSAIAVYATFGSLKITFLMLSIVALTVHCCNLQSNPLLHEVFAYTPKSEPAERLTRFEKRLYRSPNSAAAKQHTQHRKSHRADAAARKGSPLGESDW